uniref:Uncharacterized protein n=1 Tax=Terrapene triunguis TaxID=2587831 RepID=A0A674JNL2_9SAUR
MSGPESSAAGAEAREDACRDYQSSLEDLTFNSKPHINMLTILAEENVPFAKDIVSLIEADWAVGPPRPAAVGMILSVSVLTLRPISSVICSVIITTGGQKCSFFSG